jgi:hypothetical protein
MDGVLARECPELPRPLPPGHFADRVQFRLGLCPRILLCYVSAEFHALPDGLPEGKMRYRSPGWRAQLRLDYAEWLRRQCRINDAKPCWRRPCEPSGD